MKERNSLFIA